MTKWYLVFNLTEWLATELISRTLTIFPEGMEQMDILITQGNVTGITVDDTFLPLGFGEQNPWFENGYGIFKDSDENVYLGFEVAA